MFSRGLLVACKLGEFLTKLLLALVFNLDNILLDLGEVEDDRRESQSCLDQYLLRFSFEIRCSPLNGSRISFTFSFSSPTGMN